MTDELKVYPITEVRTCTVVTDPETIVWQITSGSETRHYSMAADDFVGLAKQMQIDARILKEGAKGSV